ncbi:hypothetical protein BDA96_08G171000 [Sorghum bicolor]|uniref:BHLH domain-containing protein n=1 Tax=Sorghum bicolor TaxID=4558 RepID=A0A921QGY1_SORBI|nr:hypothetical protein BDA96_08G171000 [Sorghum bicolor]
MNYPHAAAAAGPWLTCCDNDNAGEAAAAMMPTMGESGSFFADVVADYSRNELFERVWEQEGQAGGGASGSMQPAISCLWSPRFNSKSPDVRFDPPSEDEMTAWLGATVKGEELAGNVDDGGRRLIADDGGRDAVPATMGTSRDTDKEEKVPTTTEGVMMDNKVMRKAPAGGPSRKSHHGEAHRLTEKRRRHKINERLKTLQQLVPGCSKSNQASTLDQTIHYMKSLQHQVQAMSVGLASPAVYPVVQPQGMPLGTPVAMPFPAAHPPVVLGGHPPSTTMVPFGATMLQLPHYAGAAVMVPAAAAMAPLYPAPAAAPTSTAVAPGDAMAANHLRGSSS